MNHIDQIRELAGLRAQIMGSDTLTTFEAINVGVRIEDVDDMLFQYADLVKFPGFDHGDAQTFVWHAIKGANLTVGPYIASYYWDLFEQARRLAWTMKSNAKPIESRQLMITFMKSHCFQSIQVLFRNGTIHLIATMRSCNYEANFMNDLFICYNVGQVIRGVMGCTNSPINVMMNIGSLHIYK